MMATAEEAAAKGVADPQIKRTMSNSSTEEEIEEASTKKNE